MSKRSRFRGPTDKQHGKGTQALSKSVPQHLYHIYWSLVRQLNPKKSLVLICQIFGLFANLLPGKDKYPVLNSYKLMISIKMQLYEKQKTFSELFSVFLNSSLNFKNFQKKDDSHRFFIFEITDSEKLVW